MCNFLLGKATVAPPESEHIQRIRWCGCWLVLNDFLETKKPASYTGTGFHGYWIVSPRRQSISCSSSFI
jgi:hypothetical protein